MSRAVFLLLTCCALFVSPVESQNCTKCGGNSGQTCCGKFNICCKGDGWSCISADETCCAGTACIKQTTYCCPKTSDPSCPSGDCPARCCPRWTVCCSKGGRDGCCHPFEAQMLSTLAPRAVVAAPAQAGVSSRPGSAATSTVFAMFLEAGLLAEPLKVLTINTATGAATSKVVKGYDTHGESTRLFEFNRASGMFVTFEQDYSRSPVGSGGELPMNMYSISPADGAVTKTAVKKTGGSTWQYPTGYKYDASRRAMVLAIGPAPSGAATYPAASYSFYSVDSNGNASPLSTVSPSATADPLAGWIHALSPTTGTGFRFGYKNVSEGTGFGLGVTSTGTGASRFSQRSLLPTHGEYLSLDVAAGGADGALFSMAPRNGLSTSMDLIRWSAADGSPTKVLASLGDAHQPALFGDVAATMEGSRWAALTVQHPGVIINGGWALSVVANVSASPTPKPLLLPLKPRVGGGTSSVSGIGFPEATVA